MSEAPTLPALTEETMDEIQPSNEAQGNTSNEAKQGNTSNETAEEREITEISDTLVSNILEKVKQDFMKSEQEIKQKRTGKFFITVKSLYFIIGIQWLNLLS